MYRPRWKITTPRGARRPRPGDGREVNTDMDKLRYYSSLTANVHYFINRAAGVCYIRHIMHHGRYITGRHARQPGKYSDGVCIITNCARAWAKQVTINSFTRASCLTIVLLSKVSCSAHAIVYRFQFVCI